MLLQRLLLKRLLMLLLLMLLLLLLRENLMVLRRRLRHFGVRGLVVVRLGRGLVLLANLRALRRSRALLQLLMTLGILLLPLPVLLLMPRGGGPLAAAFPESRTSAPLGTHTTDLALPRPLALWPEMTSGWSSRDPPRRARVEAEAWKSRVTLGVARGATPRGGVTAHRRRAVAREDIPRDAGAAVAVVAAGRPMRAPGMRGRFPRAEADDATLFERDETFRRGALPPRGTLDRGAFGWGRRGANPGREPEARRGVECERVERVEGVGRRDDDGARKRTFSSPRDVSIRAAARGSQRFIATVR